MFDIHLFFRTVPGSKVSYLRHCIKRCRFSRKTLILRKLCIVDPGRTKRFGLIRHVREVTGLIELVWKRAAGFAKETQNGRTGTIASGRVLSLPRLGGLRHRYDRAA